MKELKEQLTKKDKEIEKLRDKLKRTEKAMLEEVNEHIEYYNADQKHLRKQVCEEIREKIEKRIEAYPIICEDENGVVRRCVFLDNIKDILDQIEKGNVVDDNKAN